MLNVTLVVVGGDAKAAEIRLKLPTTIGRAREATLTLPHPLVSRKHCEIFEESGCLFVRDLQSLNGTYVDNTKIEDRQELNPNQLLTIGNVTFRAVYATDSEVDLDTVAQIRLDTASEDSHVVVEMNEPVADESEDLHARPTKSGPTPAAAEYQEQPAEKPSILETIHANQLNDDHAFPQHSVISAMADVDTNAGKGSVSLSEIERLPTSENAVEDHGSIDIHDESNPLVNRAAQSFQGIDVDEPQSEKTVESEDSRLGSFVKKFPR